MKKLFTFAACLTATALLHTQTTIFVTPNGTGDGTTWANACNLEDAVVRSLSGAETTEIWVQSGTYYPTKMLVIPDSVKIYGGFSGTETTLSQRNFYANPTVIDGQQKIGSVFRLENSAEINGFTIQNGKANGNLQKNGGGVWADANCVIANCTVINNVAILNGGGIYAKGVITIINCIVKQNIANGSGNNTFGNCLELDNEPSCSNSGISIAGCNNGTPDFGNIGFKSDKITTISLNGVNQEWSDAVIADGCNKTWYQGGLTGNYYSDCRNNSTYGHLFSWCAVARFAHILCPAPWRVPTKADFFDLDIAMGGNGDGTPSLNGTPVTGSWGIECINIAVRNNYLNIWNGGMYGGQCNAVGVLSYQGTNGNANFWAQSGYSTENGIYSHFCSGNGTCTQCNASKNLGFTLRCVK